MNCARDAREHNLAAFQSDGEIFYRSIHPGSELLVWYTYQYSSDGSMQDLQDHTTMEAGAEKNEEERVQCGNRNAAASATGTQQHQE